jgi:AcrR family transcriptional regulator
MAAEKPTRRRGDALEDAILDVAWAELLERGYDGLTFESVASRAGTSRPVLGRRWPTRGALATAAAARFHVRNPIVIPDLGNVRDELCLLLRKMSDRVRPDLVRLLFEVLKDDTDHYANAAELRAQIVKGSALPPILARAVERGEVDPDRLIPRIVSLPGDLARHELLMTSAPLTDEAIHEIIDRIFLPLVRPAIRQTQGDARSRKGSLGKAVGHG